MHSVQAAELDIAYVALHARPRPFVEFSAGTGLQTVIEALCAKAGLDRHIGFRATQMGQVLELVVASDLSLSAGRGDRDGQVVEV